MAPNVLNRSQPNGMSVLISGAGVGGIMAALECWRRGCDVRVLDRMPSNVTTGDSFTIGPTALNGFRNWPDLQKRSSEIEYDPLVAYHDHQGKRFAGPMTFADMAPKGQTEEEAMTRRFYRHSRPKFHKMLLEQLERIGVSVEYGNEVVEYCENAESAGVVLKDGSCHQADIVVAADGLRSSSRHVVAGPPAPTISSGHALYRVAYSVELAKADPTVAERFDLVNGRSVMEMWVGPNMHAVFWRNEDEMTWVINHPDQGGATEGWSHRASKDEILKFTATIPGWPDVANRVIKTAPADRIIDWKLMWRDPQPRWTSPRGRIIQLGDAAHTFLPSSGNGATQAMEDALSLGACLSMIGSDKQKVSDATSVHNLLRFERVSCLQAFGVANAEKNSVSYDLQAGNAEQRVVHMGRWIVEHDPEKYALENYEAALAHVQDGSPFHNTNIPPGMEYRPWTMSELMEAHRKGERTVLDGDWS